MQTDEYLALAERSMHRKVLEPLRARGILPTSSRMAPSARCAPGERVDAAVDDATRK